MISETTKCRFVGGPLDGTEVSVLASLLEEKEGRVWYLYREFAEGRTAVRDVHYARLIEKADEPFAVVHDRKIPLPEYM